MIILKTAVAVALSTAIVYLGGAFVLYDWSWAAHTDASARAGAVSVWLIVTVITLMALLD